jgi:hypothetical protein
MDTICLSAQLRIHLQNTNLEIRITPHSKRKLWTANTIAITSSDVASEVPIPDLPGVSPRHTTHKWENFISVFIRISTKTGSQRHSAPNKLRPHEPFSTYTTAWFPMGRCQPQSKPVPNCLVLNREFLK